MRLTVRPAQSSDIGAVAAVLTAAFADDPVMPFVWPDRRRRLRARPRYYVPPSWRRCHRRPLLAQPSQSCLPDVAIEFEGSEVDEKVRFPDERGAESSRTLCHMWIPQELAWV